MQFKIAGYCRISKENLNNESIVNQKNIIDSYIKNNFKTNSFFYYEDNGYSGSNFERPAIQKLIQDIKDGKINCVIVKDLSRFGRNYIEVGDYLEKIFPFLNVRFIAINDNYDSNNNKNSICDLSVSFKNIIHSYYIKDLSIKIKTGHRASAKQGNYIKAEPFGYKINKKTKRLEIDNETAPIVKRIFELFINGYKLTEICKILNEDEVPTVNQHRTKDFSNNQFWRAKSIKTILKNEVYTGDTVYFKTKSIKCGSKKSIKNNEEDILVIKNTHPAIIEKDMFFKIKELLEKRTRFNKKAINQDIFENKLKCGCCGYGLKNNSTKNKGKKYFYGSKYENNNSECLKIFINENILKEFVLKQLKDKINTHSHKKVENDNEANSLEKEILKIENKLNSLRRLKVDIYEKYVENTISKDEYLSEKSYIDESINNFSKNLNELSFYINNLENNEILDYTFSLENLNREIIDKFIEKVYIYDEQKIKIYWKNN